VIWRDDDVHPAYDTGIGIKPGDNGFVVAALPLQHQFQKLFVGPTVFPAVAIRPRVQPLAELRHARPPQHQPEFLVQRRL
jgi:hypothetical protein